MAIRYKILLSSLLLTITACGGGMSANQASSASRAPASSSVFMTSASVDGRMVPLLRFYSVFGPNVGGGGHRSQPFDPSNPQLAEGAEGGLVMVSLDPAPGLHVTYICAMNLVTQTQPYTSYQRIFSSNDPGCEGQSHLSPMYGLTQYYTADGPTEGMSRPLYRCVDAAADHLDTTDPNECYAAGYHVEGILGFGG